MFIEAKDDGGGGDNWTTAVISLAKLQSNNHQQTNIQFFYRPDALLVTQPTVSKHGREKISHSMDLLTPSSPGVFQLYIWPLIAPGYLGGGFPCLSSALWCQYPWLLMQNCLQPLLSHNPWHCELNEYELCVSSVSSPRLTWIKGR